jgi:hypothetical protein
MADISLGMRRLGRLLLALSLLCVLWVPVPAKADTPVPGSWSTFSTPTTTYNLSAVSMVSANDGWAVGYLGNEPSPGYSPITGGVVLRWNGIDWSIYSATELGYGPAWLGISMYSAIEGWMVGWVQNGSRVAHWDGSSWTIGAVSGCSKLYGVAERTPSDVWAVGERCITHYDGVSWSVTYFRDAPKAYRTMYSVAPITSSKVFTAGQYILYSILYPEEYALIGHMVDGIWVIRDCQGEAFDLRAISAISADDIWAAGFNRFAHWDVNGLTFTPIEDVEFGGPQIRSLKMVSTQIGWAVGLAGIIYHWDGEAWTGVISPTTSSLLGVAMLSPFEGWAVGDAGTILHYTAPSPNHAYLPVVQQ